MARKKKEPVPINVTPKKPKQERRQRGEWVPVFLAALGKTANVRASCKMAGIDRVTAYNLRDKDPEFAKAWKDALEDAIELLEEAVRNRAMQTSDTLAIFLLKAHRPEVYRERYDHQHSGKSGGPVIVQVVEEVVSGPANPPPTASGAS